MNRQITDKKADIRYTLQGAYNLLTACKLNSYLADIDRQAEELFSRLVKQMAEREGVTEMPKVEYSMKWIRSMNNIKTELFDMMLTDE